MSRIYKLEPTPSYHALYARPKYETIRKDLLEARAAANGNLTKVSAPPPNLVDWSTGRAPIRDQGQEGSCSGHQARNVRWLAHWLACGTPPPADFSPAYCYWQARTIEGNAGTDSGATIGDELLGMEDTGICEERLMPYLTTPLTEGPSQDAIANALTYKVDLQAVPVDYSSLASVHQVLADRHPVIFGFAVPESFETCGSDGKLQNPIGESSLGGHAGSWDQINLSDEWLADVNSWGTSWGASGVGFMPATYLDRLFEAWAIIPVL
jgi:hypothetical protein